MILNVAWWNGLVFCLEVLLLIPAIIAINLLETLLETVHMMEHGVAKSLDVNVSSYYYYIYTVTQHAPIVHILFSSYNVPSTA